MCAHQQGVHTMANEEGTLLARTRELLQRTEDSYLSIYDATGLNPNWLSLLCAGKIRDPSVNKVQKLYEHLKKNTLPL
jgi:hypothetical protein